MSSSPVSVSVRPTMPRAGDLDDVAAGGWVAYVDHCAVMAKLQADVDRLMPNGNTDFTWGACLLFAVYAAAVLLVMVYNIQALSCC